MYRPQQVGTDVATSDAVIRVFPFRPREGLRITADGVAAHVTTESWTEMDSNIERLRGLPLWRDLKDVTPLAGGVSNASFKVIDGNGQFVVRIGKDYPFHQVDRVREATASDAAFQIGLSPQLVASYDEIMVLKYVEGRTYSADDVRANMERCLMLVRKCHDGMKRKVTGQGAIFWVFQILRDYAQTLMTAKHPLEREISHWMDTATMLEDAQVALPIVFGHHDLLPTNFIDDGQRLWLIDWEYAAFGTAMFDLANLSSNNFFDTQADDALLASYFGQTPSDALRRAFEAMKVASALREAMWGMVSELHLNAPGVNYAAYAESNFAQFEILHSRYLESYHR